MKHARQGEPLVLLHGFGSDKDSWLGLLPALSRSYHVVAPDLPGFGESDRLASERHGLAQQSKRLRAFVDALGLRSFHLAGASMGGGIAARFAGDYPDAVRSLMVISPLGISFRKPMPWYEAFRHDPRHGLSISSEADLKRVQRLAFDHPPQLPRIVERYVIAQGAKRANFDSKVLGELLAGGTGGLEPILPRIKAPTLIIWGKNDRILPVSCAKKADSAIPNSRLLVLNCGHGALFDEPVRVAAAYSSFLQDIARRSR